MKFDLKDMLVKMEFENLMEMLPTIKSINIKHNTLFCKTKRGLNVSLTLVKDSKNIENKIKKQSKYIVEPFKLHHVHMSKNYIFKARIINPNAHYHNRNAYGTTTIDALCNVLNNYDEFLTSMAVKGLKKPTDDALPF